MSRFYRDALGLREGRRVRAKLQGRDFEEIMFLDAHGGVEFIVIAFDAEHAESPPRGTLSAFFTHDLDRQEAQILRAGGAVVAPMMTLKRLTRSTRTAFYTDPEGNVFQLIED